LQRTASFITSLWHLGQFFCAGGVLKLIETTDHPKCKRLTGPTPFGFGLAYDVTIFPTRSGKLFLQGIRLFFSWHVIDDRRCGIHRNSARLNSLNNILRTFTKDFLGLDYRAMRHANLSRSLTDSYWLNKTKFSFVVLVENWAIAPGGRSHLGREYRPLQSILPRPLAQTDESVLS
jgi:hypothetical protein